MSPADPAEFEVTGEREGPVDGGRRERLDHLVETGDVCPSGDEDGSLVTVLVGQPFDPVEHRLVPVRVGRRERIESDWHGGRIGRPQTERRRDETGGGHRRTTTRSPVRGRGGRRQTGSPPGAGG